MKALSYGQVLGPGMQLSHTADSRWVYMVYIHRTISCFQSSAPRPIPRSLPPAEDVAQTRSRSTLPPWIQSATEAPSHSCPARSVVQTLMSRHAPAATSVSVIDKARLNSDSLNAVDLVASKKSTGFFFFFSWPLQVSTRSIFSLSCYWVVCPSFKYFLPPISRSLLPAEILSPFLSTEPLQYVTKILFTQATTDCLTTNKIKIDWLIDLLFPHTAIPWTNDRSLWGGGTYTILDSPFHRKYCLSALTDGI